MADSGKELRGYIMHIKSDIAQIKQNTGAIKSTQESQEESLRRIREDIKDHSTKISSLEIFRGNIKTAVAVVTLIITSAIAYISNLIHK